MSKNFLQNSLKKNRRIFLWYIKVFFLKIKNRDFFLSSLTEKELRSLLRLNPSWEVGHLLLGLFSYKSYLHSRDFFYLGTLKASYSALVELENEPKYQFLLNGLILSIEKDLVNSIKFLIDFLNSNKKEDIYQIQALDSLGSNYLVLGEREKAFKTFNEIPESMRSEEVRTALKLNLP